jgi:hypothetical protein
VKTLTIVIWGLLAAGLCALVAGLTGCARVPDTRVSYDPAAHTLSLRSPKNVSIGSLTVAVQSNGIVSLTLTNYAATNDASVVEAVGKANLEALRAASDAGLKALDAAKGFK